MKRRIDLNHLNPVSGDEGDVWAGSSAGRNARDRMLASTEVAVGAQTVTPTRRKRARYLIPAAALALVAATVVFVRDGGPVPAASRECPVTAPTAEAFVPPDPDLADRASELGYVWYGSDELWTVLDPDGGYSERKSVWWSANFPGGATENSPEITVVARRLDHPGSIASSRYGTNAYTGEEGWFMIADFPFALPDGCWEVTGEYKGASLSFTVLVEEAGCPVTFATPPYLVPPEQWPATPPADVPLHEGHWYGTEDLWTIIPSTGASIHAPGDKLFYWSQHFMTASDDFLQPELTVTAERLDGEAPTVTAPQANNGGRADTGTFMVTGVVLPTAGCWEITAEYRGASLSFVVEVVDGFESATDPCLAVFRAVGSEQSPLEGVGLADAIPATLTSMFEVSSFTCVATQEAGAAWVRGVFVELVDQSGIGAIYAVLHDRESEAGWRGYLAENFPGLTLEFELGDKWILGVNTAHPRASEVVGALSDQGDNFSLWAAARDAFEAGSYGGR